MSELNKKHAEMLEHMQTPEARKGMKAAFDASPKQLAEAALKLAGSTMHDPGCPCGFCKIGFTSFRPKR